MRIAHFIETETAGGAEKLIVELCVWAKLNGHTPVVIHFGFGYFHQECSKHAIEQVIIEDNSNFKRFHKLVHFAFQLSAIIKDNNIDILHAHLFGPIFGSALAARLAGVRHVGTLHDIYMIQEKFYRIRQIQLAALLGCRLVTVSKMMESFYRSKAKFSKNALRTIYNSVPDPLENNALPFHNGQLDSIKSNANAVLCVFVGRLVRLKRTQDLIAAFDILAQKYGPNHSLYLAIAGDGEEFEYIKSLANQSKMPDRIIMLGRVENIYGLLKRADIYLQVSETEGLSLSILEAIASGLPAILTQVGSNQELVESSVNGYLIPVKDSEQLAEKLSVLSTSPELRKSFSTASRSKYQNEFEYSTKMNEYLELYSKD